MNTYTVGGRAAAPSTSSEPHAVLWVPANGKTIYVVRIHVENFTATLQASISLQRTSTRGTPGSTITPDIDNDQNQAVAPVSGVLLDLADYTVVPVFQGPRFSRHQITRDGGAHEYRLDGYAVPQNTGLMVEVVSILPALSVTYEWME